MNFHRTLKNPINRLKNTLPVTIVPTDETFNRLATCIAIPNSSLNVNYVLLLKVIEMFKGFL